MSNYYNRYDGKKRDQWGQEVNNGPKIVKRFTATIGDHVFIRNSPKIYTHAVIGHKEGKALECLKWCNSAPYAEQQADFYIKSGYLDVQVVEVVASQYIKEYIPDTK